MVLFNGFTFKGKKDGFSHERLAFHLIEKGFTLTRLSFETGISMGSLSNYFKGKQEPSGEKLVAICFSLGIKAESLYRKKDLIRKK